ncbi:MAG TPA: transglutaminaseTgpA domain-containing protein, partial [Ilumatobacteraceae bacterium]
MAAVGLMRARTAVLGVEGIVLALMAGRVFDQQRWELVAAALVPAAIGVAVVGRSWWVRALWCGGAALVGVSIAVVVAGGDVPADVLTAFVDGPRRLLSTEWPSPVLPELVATVAALLAVAVASSVALSGTPRWHLLPQLPLVMAFVAISAWSAPAGAPTGWLVPLGLLCIVAALLRPEHPAGERVRMLRGERRVVGIAGIAVVAGLAVAVPVAFADRADPRSDDPAERTSAVVDPIEATTALRKLDPPIDVYHITGDGEIPDRWRIAALDRYDGERWAPTITLRPIGRRLGPDQPGATDYDIELETSLIPFVPLPGPPVLVDAAVATDADRTVVQLVETPTPGQFVRLSASTAPVRADAGSGPVRTRPVDEISSSFTDLATELAGDGTVLDQLTSLEQTLANTYELDAGAPGGGLQQELIERFLNETQRGNE